MVKDLMSELSSISFITGQKHPKYLEWINSDLIDIVNEFVQRDNLPASYFIKDLNRVFKTARFELLLKRWLVEYFLKLFRVLNDKKELILEDTPLNRFGIEKYRSKFEVVQKIKWINRPFLPMRVFSILFRCAVVFYLSLNKGVKISVKRKKYKVMREAVWGLYDIRGYYFHDDFIVDGCNIKMEDLLLFSRGIPVESDRLAGYHDAKKSPYAHFDLSSLSLGLDTLFLRIIPNYIILASLVLFKELLSANFSLYWSIYSYFVYNALPYEKVFSHFKVNSELGHNYFSAGHIPEAIICQNYRTGYYLMHWSDNSVGIDKYLLSFLGCDKFLIWGKAHLQGVEGNPQVLMPTGYIFKRFIKEVRSKRDKILSDIDMSTRGKIVTFFAESFGGECKMTGENYVVFWESALKLAEIEKNSTILMKPKEFIRYDKLSNDLKKKIIDIKNKMDKMTNVYIVMSEKWSFIEFIGISDIVVSQGMTSSSTIAIICGIEGLYLDQASFDHPFSRLFKDKIVFDDPEKLISMVNKIIAGTESPLSAIQESLLRDFDAYPDDRGIDILRDVLSRENRKRTGIIVQARMGSSRLPGKTMKPILGRPMLEILIERLKAVKGVDILIIATTRNKNDDVIENLAGQLGATCFRGDEDDVLNRYYKCAKLYGLDVIVRITSDCPLTDPSLVDNLIEHYLSNIPIDYATNTIKRTYPRGFDIEVFSFESLEKAAKEAVKPYQREHVTPFIYENMKGLNYENEINASKYRVTVDTMEDLELVNYIYELLHKNEQFGYRDVIGLLDSRPDLVTINQFVEQKKI